jgi:hypothetical protein
MDMVMATTIAITAAVMTATTGVTHENTVGKFAASAKPSVATTGTSNVMGIMIAATTIIAATTTVETTGAAADQQVL